MQPDRQQPPPSTTVLAHSCSPCASHSTAASAHVAAELSIQVRGAKVLCDGDGALPSEGSLLQIEWQLWLRSQQRTTPNAAPAERCRVSFDKPRRELHAGTTRRAPNIELQPRPSFQDKSRAGGRGGRRPPCGNEAWPRGPCGVSQEGLRSTKGLRSAGGPKFACYMWEGYTTAHDQRLDT